MINVTVDKSVKTKFRTLITKYEYSRKTPRDTTKRKVLATYGLPLPINMPSDHFNAQVRNHDLGEIGTSIDTLKDGFVGADLRDQIGTLATGAVVAGGIFAALSTLTGGKTNRSTDAFSAAYGKAALGAAAALPFVGAYLGEVRNPHTALLFEGMQLRQFSFTFRFTPRNEGETNEYNSFIKDMKLSMHPTYSKTFNSFALDYPNLFEVDFSSEMSEFEGYPKVRPAFLTSLSVNNTSQGNVMYKGGRPVIIELTMNFQEIDIMTRETFTGNFESNALSTQRGAT